MNPYRRTSVDRQIGVALLRVSTADQELGPDAQRRAIESWAKREGVEIRSWWIEQGVSGATPLERRPILLQALEDLKTLRAGVFAVAKRDRLARDVVGAALIERLVERAGARLCAADGTGDTKGPEGLLLRGMIDLFAAYERLMIASRTKAALAAKRAKGERTGEVPFGYGLADDGRTLVESEPEQAKIAVVRSLRARGMTIRAIVVECRRRGFTSRAGGPFQKTTVERIIKRAG